MLQGNTAIQIGSRTHYLDNPIEAGAKCEKCRQFFCAEDLKQENWDVDFIDLGEVEHWGDDDHSETDGGLQFFYSHFECPKIETLCFCLEGGRAEGEVKGDDVGHTCGVCRQTIQPGDDVVRPCWEPWAEDVGNRIYVHQFEHRSCVADKQAKTPIRKAA